MILAAPSRPRGGKQTTTTSPVEKRDPVQDELAGLAAEIFGDEVEAYNRKGRSEYPAVHVPYLWCEIVRRGESVGSCLERARRKRDQLDLGSARVPVAVYRSGEEMVCCLSARDFLMIAREWIAEGDE